MTVIISQWGDGEVVEGRDGWRRIGNTGRTREEAKGMTGQ